MSKQSTLTNVLEDLRRKSYRTTLVVTGDEASLEAANDETSFVVISENMDDLVEKVQGRLDSTGDIEPSENAKSFIDYAIKLGSVARFLAIDENGEAVIHAEYDVPVFHRQRAAARRNGKQSGAVAVFDRVTSVVERIS